MSTILRDAIPTAAVFEMFWSAGYRRSRSTRAREVTSEHVAEWAVTGRRSFGGHNYDFAGERQVVTVKIGLNVVSLGTPAVCDRSGAAPDPQHMRSACCHDLNGSRSSRFTAQLPRQCVPCASYGSGHSPDLPPSPYAATWANVGACVPAPCSPGRSALTVRPSRRPAGVFWVAAVAVPGPVPVSGPLCLVSPSVVSPSAVAVPLFRLPSVLVPSLPTCRCGHKGRGSADPGTAGRSP